MGRAGVEDHLSAFGEKMQNEGLQPLVVDTFAYYYNQVKDGQRYPYYDFYRMNKTDPDSALVSAMEWWGALPRALTKEDVVFEATTAQIQELVIESPVPVLVDVHAEW